MSSRFRFQPRVFARTGAPVLDGSEVLARLATRRTPLLLDSAAGWPREFSLFAFDPLPPAPPQQFEELADFHALLEPCADATGVPGPFHGGFAGALAYDLGVAGEELALPGEPWGQPLVVGGLYTDFLVLEPESGRSWLVLGEDPGDGRPSVDARRAAIETALTGPVPVATTVRGAGPLVRHTAPAQHRARVERARAAIARGDYYQANLAHRFTRAVEGDPVDLYRRLCASNPAPYAGFVRWGDRPDGESGGAGPGALLSTSPELLLELRTDGARRVARTRPIKGTAPRSSDPALDRERAAFLLASAKDRAELAMIVDLERNDLARTARTGTVRVEDFPALRSYARVHHLTADVVAEPRAGASAFDVLAAVFPGGSVTGAPKLASMRAIAELEGEGRGFFCGALGFVDTRGEARWNVLIRSVLWRPRSSAGGGEVSFRVGGGITFGSVAEAEDEETLAKAAALVAAFEQSEPAPEVLEVGRA
jgi:para-aminobenzoate synthetase component 1